MRIPMSVYRKGLSFFYKIPAIALHELAWWLHAMETISHDDVMKCKHFPRYWPFVQGIHWSPVNSPHKGQWCGTLMFSLICTRKNGWVNNDEAGDLRCHHVHYDVTVMQIVSSQGSVMQSFDSFFLVLLNKQPCCLWGEKSWHSCGITVILTRHITYEILILQMITGSEELQMAPNQDY